MCCIFFTEFHRDGKLTRGINNTLIAFIPKVESTQRLADFCPISLIGRLYKFLTKVFANRLKNVFGSVISFSQSAFVKKFHINFVMLLVVYKFFECDSYC